MLLLLSSSANGWCCTPTGDNEQTNATQVTQNQSRIRIVKSSERMDFSQKSLLIGLVCQLIAVVSVSASAGDKSPYYRNCINSCLKQTCQNSELNKSEFNFLLPDGDFRIVVRWSQLCDKIWSFVKYLHVLSLKNSFKGISSHIYFVDILLYKKGMEESISDHLIEMWRNKNFQISAFENVITWNCKDECKYE